MKIAICASAKHYDKLPSLADELTKLGHMVLLPNTAEKMWRDPSFQKQPSEWQRTAEGYKEKSGFIRAHFDTITTSDAILVCNFDKGELKNYIGPNVLMEMSLAFSLRLPIYLLQPTPIDSPLIDEIYGLLPIVIDGNLEKLPLSKVT